MAIPFTSSAPRRPASRHEQAEIIDALPQPSAIVDGAGSILFANAGFERLMPSGATLHNVLDVVAPEQRPLLAALLTSTIAGAPCDRPRELRLADGLAAEWVGALLSLLPVGNALPSVLLQFIDLSEQKRREAEIANREQRWSQALDSASTGVWDQNFETGENVYSDMWRTLRGLAPDDPIAATTEEWLELIHPDDRDRVRHAIERQNAGDPDYTVFDYRERHKDGHYVWIECRGSCVEWGENGRPTRIIGTDVDVTARKTAEEVAARTAQRLELALETSRIGIFEADLENYSVQWDERLIEIFGLEGPAREFPDGTWQGLIHPDDYDLAVRRNDTAIATGGELYNQYRIIRPSDGEIRHLRSRATILHDPNGRRRLLGVTWDITEDVHLHQQLDSAKTLAESRNRELESAREHMEHMALHDHLTGLPNRRYLDAMLDEFARTCERDGKGLAVFHVDLDRFKEINDTLGHHAGDIMLRHAAQVLLDNVRDGDFVARIGGDEFVILAPYQGPCKKLSKVADRIIDQMRTPVTLDGYDCRFGSSIGIACNSGKVDARQLLLNADMALYHAKNKGRNRHEFFSTASHGHVVNTKRLSDEILRGLEKDEFTPFYQFQFDARTLDIAGVETLARWRHPERGILTPEAFLAVADDLDAVAKIDAVILDRALADFGTWQEAGLSIPKLSVNVSSRRLHDPDLKKALKTLKVPAGVLSFELLESIFLDDFDDQVKANLALLRRLGISIEIDDFGTGHASIVSLLRLNPRTLKIDRELIKRVPASQEQRKLVGAIIDIGHSLNVKVVAEGVETEDHIRALRDLGCDVLQGYGLCRPMPFSETEAFLRSQTWKRPDRS